MKQTVDEYVYSLNDNESKRNVELGKQSFFLRSEKNTIALLMIHGFTSSTEETKYLASTCHQSAEVDVLSICLPGHGSTPDDMKRCKISDWVNAGLEAYNCLSENYREVIVLGVSMGALIAIQCALVKKPLGLVCVAPALEFADWRLRWGGPVAPIITKISSKLGMKTVKSNVTDINKGTIYPHFPIESTAPLYKLSSQTKKQLYQLNCPLLVCHSKDDMVIKPRAAELLFDKANSDHKELIWSVGEHNFVALPNLEQQKVVEKIVYFVKDPLLYFANMG